MTGRDVTIDRQDDVVIARLQGEIDLANTPMIATQILEAMPNDVLGLVVDLSAVRYIDSVGIRMLFGLVRDLRSARQRLTIALEEPSPIRRLLKITNLDEAVPVLLTVEECVAALRAGPSAPY